MFKSQKIIVFSILLAIVGIGATVALAVGISVRDSVNPDKSSAAISDVVSNITGKVTCKSTAGILYSKADMIRELSYALYNVDVSKPSENLGYTPYNGNITKVNKDGTYSISASAPKEYNFLKLGVKSSNVLATNCSDFSKLVNDSGNPVCLNKEITKDITNSCGVTSSGYMCQRDLDTSSFKGFDFALSNCAEPVLDLKTKAINVGTTISKNVGETLTMYFNGEDLSDYNTLNTNYYFGAQGLSSIFSTYKVYSCTSLADTNCTTEVILPTNPPEVSVSPWNIIAIGKNKTIKIEGKLLATAKDNIPVKIQYAQLPSSILPVLSDSNNANNVWNGSVSITSTTPVVTPPVVTPPVVNPPVVSSSTGTRTTTSSSRRSTSSNGSVVSDTSSTESTVSTESSSSAESSLDTEYSTSSKSSSSIKPYVPVTQTPSSDNNTLFLALVSLLVLFLVSIFVVYRKYKSEKESKEVFNRSPLEETPPTPTTPPSTPTV